jgi:hypothetical protein
MKSFSLLLLTFAFGFSVQSQVNIKLEDAASHIGDSVTACGKVAGIRFMEGAKGQPTLINMGCRLPSIVDKGFYEI